MNNLIKFMLFVLVFTMSLGMFTPVYAANVVINVGVGAKVASIDTSFPNTNQVYAEWDNAGATDVYIQYAAGSEYSTADTVTIVATDGLAIANCGGTATTDADDDGTPDGSGAVLGQIYTYTFSASTNGATTSTAFCINITGAAANPGNYSFIMADDNGNFGGGFVYAADDNDVLVTANVTGQELEFWIRDAADTTDTNTCALGTLNTTSVSTCNYALKVRTTATNGYTISWTSDGDLDRSGTATIDAIAQDTAIAAGVEGYGVTFTPGANTDGGSCTAQGIWTAAYDDPVSTTAQNLVACTKANLPAATAAVAYVHNMDHQAAIDPSTPAGSYQQIVTYYVTAQF